MKDEAFEGDAVVARNSLFSVPLVSPFELTLSEARSFSGRHRGVLGWSGLETILNRGELGEDCEGLDFWHRMGDWGLLLLLCTPSTVAAGALSLTCNGDGVGCRGVLRPSTECENWAFCRCSSMPWDSNLGCSEVPVIESIIITEGTSKGIGVAPKCSQINHSFETCSRVSGTLN